jgi:hypothetical protein
VCHERGTISEPVGLKVALAGSQSSAAAGSPALPPTMRTRLSGSRVAVCGSARSRASVPAALNVPVVGSQASADG